MITPTRMAPLGVVTLSILLLGACAAQRVPEMNETKMTGGDFNHHLAREYKIFSNFEAYEMHDWSDAVVYADKSLAAAAGNTPQPDDLTDRNIEGADNLAALQNAHRRLILALSTGAKTAAPDNAAKAQANFDCWVEQQEEGWQTEHIAACRDGFERAMKATDLAMMPAPAAVAATEKPKPTTIAAVIPAQNYFVFFDWDSTALSEGAQSVLAAAVQRTRETGQSVSLVGHADASGTTAYNSGLSQRRAEMVKQTLVSSGVPANSIASRWVGEGDPLVVTGDGVREPQNRRVEIIVEKMMPTS